MQRRFFYLIGVLILLNCTSRSTNSIVQASPNGLGTALPISCSGSPVPTVCVYGYVYSDGSPVNGASVQIDSPYGSLYTTTASGALSTSAYFQANLSTNPLLVSPGDSITIHATYNGRTANTTFVVGAGGHQVDVIIIPAFDDWWDTAYSYRRPIPITTGSALGAGTIIKVDGMDLDALIGQAKARADHNDVRIVRRVAAYNWQEVARVYYTGWDIEFQLAATINAGTDSSYYLYYGNPSAGSPPTFSLPQGWWVDMYRDKWWSDYGGTWSFNEAMNYNNVCDPGLDHDGRIGSAFDESDKFRGRLFIPYDGTWTFRVYTNDGYRLYLDDAEVGHFDGYDGDRWVTIGSMNLKPGWHKMDLRNMWVNCGAWRFTMAGPSFSDQIVPAHYFQQVWDGVKTGNTPGTEDARVVSNPPIVTFNAMNPNASVVQGQSISFQGTAIDNDESGNSITQYVWRSDVNGLIGTQASLTISSSTLAAGSHTIYFRARDNEGVWSEEVGRPLQVTAPIAPAITSLAPSSTTAGGAGFTLTVNGSNFINGAIVYWNGSARATTFIHSAQLTAAIPSADIASAGSINVSVVNPGGATSNAQTFTVNTAGTPTYTPTATRTATPTATRTATPTPTATPSGGNKAWTFMLYLAGDNDLHAYLERAIAQLEAQQPNPDVNVVVLFDNDRKNDSWRFLVQPGGNYTLGVNKWYLGEVNTGDPQSLIDFINWTRANYPAQHYYLALADHGRGTSGVAWDDSSSKDYLTTPELRAALNAATNSGAWKIDVLHYDACLMALFENAYQVKEYANYLVASENLGWSIFAYDAYTRNGIRGISGARAPYEFALVLPKVNATTTARQLATDIANAYFNHPALSTYPRTISALDLSRATNVRQALDALATALRANLNSIKTNIQNTRTATQKFDSRDYFKITQDDEYVDLYHLAAQLKTYIADATVQSAAQNLMNAITTMVVVNQRASGMWGYDEQTYWDLQNANGVALYFPPKPGTADYNRYIGHQTFVFTTESVWDQFLVDYFGLLGLPPEPGSEVLPPGMLRSGLNFYLPYVDK
ncbi:MAG: hypothetical protein HZC40_26605 [Chloroflexi bacterium]|nr:hypothetical protein [Chloroflexota bacterium]